MTYITNDELKKMIKYHFVDVTEDELNQIRLPFGLSITPATIENMCLRAKTIDDFVTMLNGQTNLK